MPPQRSSSHTPVGDSILDRNLAALSRTNPTLADLVRRTPPRPDVRFIETDEGALSAEIGNGPAARALASRRRPLDEARRQMEPVDPASAAVFVVGGFGLGYHVEALAKRLGRTGLVVVFEPDVALLRAVLERIDHAHLLGGSGGAGGVGGAGGASGPGKSPGLNVALLSDADDTGAMGQAIQGLEGIVALGVQLVEHAPSKARLSSTHLNRAHGAASALADSAAAGTETGEQALARFHERFVTLVKGVKLTIVTTLVQIRTTLRNLTQNVDRYALCPGIDDLKDCCAGRPAVVVSAGPSLARNIDLLSAPGIRERVVIIAVQTVLKTLLRKGIKPHFVTALDYSDLSSRFYEGLTREDVEGVTLIVEPKVNPAVLLSFPGDSVRCTGDAHLDKLLTPARGPSLSPPRGTLTPGATVAHLAYYLARSLGCDPVALIGQDLAFTDGQYYAAGAAIHTVWSGELNAFQTLESLEWQRIMRMGGHLHRATDVLGRPVFTDEQMNSYRLQFERDFLADVRRTRRDARGTEHALSIYDCTEGGVRKQHTTPLTLAAFLDRFAPATAPSSVRVPTAPARAAHDGVAKLAQIVDHLQSVAEQAEQVRRISDEAAGLLDDMLEVLDDERRLNELIDQSAALGRKVAALEPAYGVVHLLAQSGALNRMKADRALQLAADLPAKERQKRQIERDRANVRSLSASAKELSRLLDHAIGSLPLAAGGRGEAKLTREPARNEASETAPSSAESADVGGRSVSASQAESTEREETRTDGCRSRVVAIVAFDPLFTPLGVERRGVLSPLTPIVLRGDARASSPSVNQRSDVHRRVAESAEDSSTGSKSLRTPRLCGEIRFAHDQSWPNLLALTISRLRRCERLSAIRILTPDVAAARDALGSLLRAAGSDEAGSDESRPAPPVPIEFALIEREEMETDRRCVAPARLLARDSWRSAPGSFTCYDEVFYPRATLAAMGRGEASGDRPGIQQGERQEAALFDAALIVGPDWGLVDPALCDRLIERHQSSPSEFRLVFSQSPPGLAGVVLHHSLIHEVARLREGNARALGTRPGVRGHSETLGTSGKWGKEGKEDNEGHGDAKSGENATREHTPVFVQKSSHSIGPLASIGGMLAYVPSAPATDLIAYPVCVSVDPIVRDAGVRLVLDQTDERGRGVGVAWDVLRLLAQRHASLDRVDAIAVAQASAEIIHERETQGTLGGASSVRSRTSRTRTGESTAEPPAHLIVPIVRVLDDETGEVEYADAAAVCEVIRKALVERRDTAITLAGSRCASGAARSSATANTLASTTSNAAGSDSLASHLAGRLDWRADPINHPGLLHILRRARLHPESGFFGALSIHLRTGLLTTPERIEELLDECEGRAVNPRGCAGPCGVDVLSVDLPGESAAVYRAITGIDGYGQARANLERVLQRRRARADNTGGLVNLSGSGVVGSWLARPLLCLRMVRCDQSYAEIETFYNRWMSRADWAVLDPLPVLADDDRSCANTRRVLEGSPRIRALPLPEVARRRFARTERVYVPNTTDAPGYWPSEAISNHPHATPSVRVQSLSGAHAPGVSMIGSACGR